MSNVVPLESDDVMFDQASEWIAKIDRKLNKSEQQAFKAWLAEDIQHQALLIKMASLWDKMDSLNQLAELFPDAQLHESKQNRKSNHKWYWAAAASIFITVFTSILLQTQNLSWLSDDQQFVRYETAVGENSTIILPDNSKVQLNTNSVLLVKYTDKYRLLELQRGELLVEVAHNKKRPLSVVANHQVIQAVGTAFSVQVEAKKVELIVTDGRVIVGQLKKAEHPTAKTLTIDHSSLAVSKGELASLDIDKQKTKVVKIDNDTINKNLSWRQGHIVFKGESLAEAMAEVSRYTSVKFEIADQELNKIQIAGRFKTGDVAGLIGALNNNFNIKTDRVNKNLIVLRKQG